MTFLQPLLLWGLPLVMVPVLIHLFNRLRHRTKPWAAMMFLRQATQRATRYAKLRQWLILCMRVLAVAALVLALSRPMVGGWMGWLPEPVPDTVLILLDRSASMEARFGNTGVSLRDQGRQQLWQSAARFGSRSHVVLVDSANPAPRSVDVSADRDLAALPSAQGTGADLPAMLQAAADWLDRNRPGQAEIWIASDAQRSNWRPLSSVWEDWRREIQELPMQVKVRLLSFDSAQAPNVSVDVSQAALEEIDQRFVLELDLEFRRNNPGGEELPVGLQINGQPTQWTLAWQSGTKAQRLRRRVPLPASASQGWGRVFIPGDGNPADNEAFFTFGPGEPAVTAIVAEDPFCREVFALALAATTDASASSHVLRTPAEIESAGLADFDLLIWQGAPPVTVGCREEVHRFVRDGGVALQWPPGQQVGEEGSDDWGAWVEARGEEVWPVSTWNRQEGPWSDTAEGWALPVEELEVRRRRQFLGENAVLAAFDDGWPLLARAQMGRGSIYACATLPHPEWSRLDEGAVLVPMMQRLRAQAGRRHRHMSMIRCGQELPPHPDGPWLPVSEAGSQGLRPSLQTGLYRSGNRLMAVNLADTEKVDERLSRTEVEGLFGGLDFHYFAEDPEGSGELQTEWWRGLLVAMLVFLLVESALIMPGRASRVHGTRATGGGTDHVEGAGRTGRRAA